MSKFHRIIKIYLISKRNILIFLPNNITPMLKILLYIKLVRAQLIFILVLMMVIHCYKVNIFVNNQQRWFHSLRN